MVSILHSFCDKNLQNNPAQYGLAKVKVVFLFGKNALIVSKMLLEVIVFWLFQI